jgi:hypothetical protein
MATIQNGDQIYIRSVLGLPYEYLTGNAETGRLALVDVLGDPKSRWIAQTAPGGGWLFECQDGGGVLRFLDSDAGMNVNLDDDPADASTHWDLIQTGTPGRWQICSRSYVHFLNGGTAEPSVISDGSLESTHWELLLIAL